jgi:hypothetical protein
VDAKPTWDLVELRVLLARRGVTVLRSWVEDGVMKLLVPPDQEAAFRAAMDEWSKTGLVFYTKGPTASGQTPPPPE